MNPRHYVRQLAMSLFEARGSDLLRYVRRRVRTESDARDIAQEAYLRFIRLAKPDVIENPEAYLFRIAGNLVWEHQLRQRNEARHAAQKEPAIVEYTSLDLAVSTELVQRVRAVLDELPPTPRAAIVLHLRDGLTCAAIGAQMGVSVSMVKKHLSGALAYCRQRLRDQNLQVKEEV